MYRILFEHPAFLVIDKQPGIGLHAIDQPRIDRHTVALLVVHADAGLLVDNQESGMLKQYPVHKTSGTGDKARSQRLSALGSAAFSLLGRDLANRVGRRRR